MAGHFYFLTTATLDRKPFLRNHPAAAMTMHSLLWLGEQGTINLQAAVIMPDHIHFILELRQGSLDNVMHSLKSYSSNRINKILGRKGHLWQRQYHERAIRTEKNLKDTIWYCLKNPVRKGLVENFREYPHWYCAYKV
jgi:putative transposase